MPGILYFWFSDLNYLFLFCHSDLNIRQFLVCFVVDLSTVVIFVLGESFNSANSLR